MNSLSGEVIVGFLRHGKSSVMLDMFNHHHPGAGELLTDHDFRTEMLVRSNMLIKFHFAVYGG